MLISEIRSNQIVPFEIEDTKLIKLFSFFLHSAPTTSSASAMNIDTQRLESNWNAFIGDIKQKNYIIIPDNQKIEDYFEKYNFLPDSTVNRLSKGFVCKRKGKDETDYACVLRHLRNAIAHSHVFMNDKGNRKYILFEDYNTTGKQSSILLFSQADLSKLKRIIVR